MKVQDWYSLLQTHPPNGDEMNPTLGLGLYLARLKGRGLITFQDYLKIEEMLFKGEIQFIPGNE